MTPEEYKGANLVRTIRIRTKETKVLFLDSELDDVRVFLYIGNTEVYRASRKVVAGFETLGSESTDAEYSLNVPGTDTENWRAGQPVIMEVWYAITGESMTLGTRREIASKMIEMASKTDRP